nr:hypothetical protein [Candidatus Sigynarchaeota archaeon]
MVFILVFDVDDPFLEPVDLDRSLSFKILQRVHHPRSLDRNHPGTYHVYIRGLQGIGMIFAELFQEFQNTFL